MGAKIAELSSPLILPGVENIPDPDAALPEDESDTKSPDPQEPAQPLDLKALFRELARRVHPDFASDAADARRRTRLMTEANDAFRRKDAGMLQRMLHGQDPSAPRETAAEELARTLAHLIEVDRSIVHADAEIDTLTHSELAKLQESTLLAAEKGRDLLAEMAARVKGNIGMAMRRYDLDMERKKRKQAAFDPTSLLSAETTPL